jgi:hypothetical protein
MITIIIPIWLCYLLIALIILQGISTYLSIWKHYLEWKRNRKMKELQGKLNKATKDDAPIEQMREL